jgi:hypothetical protein
VSEDRDAHLTRLAEIQRARKVRTVGGALTSIAVGQLLFAAFAFGHSRGPVPLQPLELLIGMGLALVFGAVLAVVTTRRRLETTSKFVLRLTEGRHRRRVAVFSDFFTIDQEVVLGGTVETLDVEDDKLVLRYIDPRFDGPVLRELEGTPNVLGRLVDAMKPKPAAT